MNVETVCTEAELTSYFAGQLTGQSKLLPPGWPDATQARVQALDDVLAHLLRRVPPIREGDLTAPSELKRAVMYGAEMWLYWYALTTAGQDSILVFKHDRSQKRFAAEMNGLTPTILGSLRGNSNSFSWSRR